MKLGYFRALFMYVLVLQCACTGGLNMKFIINVLKYVLVAIFSLWEFFFVFALSTEEGDAKGLWIFFIILGLLLFVLLLQTINNFQKKINQKENENKKNENKKNVANDLSLEEDNTVKERVEADISISDMYQFVQIPFEWKWVMQLQGNPGNRWFMLNMNNQFVALHYIQDVINLIEEKQDEILEISGFDFCTEDIDFGYPKPMYMGCRPCTFILCTPYTKKGKVSKYPVTLHFETSEYLKNEYNLPPAQIHPVLGEIHVLKDGNIGSGFVSFITRDIKIEFGLYGISLIIKKVSQLSTGRTMYKYVLEE